MHPTGGWRRASAGQCRQGSDRRRNKVGPWALQGWPGQHRADRLWWTHIKSIGSLCSTIRNRFLLADATACRSSCGLTWHLKARGLCILRISSPTRFTNGSRSSFRVSLRKKSRNGLTWASTCARGCRGPSSSDDVIACSNMSGSGWKTHCRWVRRNFSWSKQD